MQRSQESYKQLSLPLFSSQCKVSTGAFEPTIFAEEAGHVTHPCHNPFRKNIITCQDEFRDEFVDEVDGLDFNISLSPQPFILPPYIPVVDRSAFNFQNIPDTMPVVATTLRDIIRKQLSSYAGSMHEPLGVTYSSNISNKNAFKGKRVLLFLTGPDTMIEPVWHQRYSSGLYTMLRRAGIDLVTGFNFSLFQGECAFSQGLNLKKSLYSCYEMEQNGIREVVPHIYAMNNHQLNRWINWLRENPTVQYCTMNCQVQRSDAEIDQIIYNVSTLLLKIPYLHLILQGYRFTQLYRFGPLLKRIHLADATPVKFAHSRRRMTGARSISKKPVFATYQTSNQTAIENMVVRQAELEFIKKQYNIDMKGSASLQANKKV